MKDLAEMIIQVSLTAKISSSEQLLSVELLLLTTRLAKPYSQFPSLTPNSTDTLVHSWYPRDSHKNLI